MVERCYHAVEAYFLKGDKMKAEYYWETFDLFDHLRCSRYIMKWAFICLITLLFVPASIGASRTKGNLTELTLYPSKAPEAGQRYRLLPSAEEQSDADALELYKKAIQFLPEDSQMEQIARWARTPLDELPRKEVESTIEQLKPILQFLEQAGRCKHCEWPFEVEIEHEILSEYRKLAYVLALQARFKIAEGQYDDAIGSIRAGLSMGRHLSKSSALQHGLVGIAISAFMCRQLEQFVQAPDAPNIYWSFQSLPRPLIDLTKRMEFEEHSVRERVGQLMNRLDCHMAGLQCIEALRYYAGTHKGKFPSSLAEITEVAIPNDLVTQKPFVYNRSGSEAVLKNPAPEDAESYEALHYRLILKEIEIEQENKMPDDEQKQ